MLVLGSGSSSLFLLGSLVWGLLAHPPMRYALTLALTLAACFTVQSFALRAVGGRTTKSESNYFSSLGRIQAGALGGPEVMLLGSSITGRLPDRANGFDGFANMGCDGGSALDALRAMDRGTLPSPPWVVIEANTLHLALAGRPSEVAAAMERPWFRAGLNFSGVSAYSRPSAFLYSRLLSGKIGGYGTEGGPPDLGVASVPALVKSATETPLAEAEEKLVREMVAILANLRSRGTRAVIVWLPPSRRYPGVPEWLLELAFRAEIPFWDLGQEALPEAVSLTDGVHMSAPSAARTVITLRKGLDHAAATSEGGPGR